MTLLNYSILGCALLVAVFIVTSNEMRRRQLKKLAKSAMRGSTKLTRSIVEPVWKRYRTQLSKIFVGLGFILLSSLWIKYAPFHLHSFELKFWIISIASPPIDQLIAIGFLVLGIILVALGFYRLIGGRKVLEIVPGKEFIETLELFLSKDKEKK